MTASCDVLGPFMTGEDGQLDSLARLRVGRPRNVDIDESLALAPATFPL
jgi:hypothetical protein